MRYDLHPFDRPLCTRLSGALLLLFALTGCGPNKPASDAGASNSSARREGQNRPDNSDRADNSDRTANSDHTARQDRRETRSEPRDEDSGRESKSERRRERKEERREDSTSTNNGYPQPGSRSSQASTAPASSDAAGSYDYYILNLSWSPEFCATHQGNEQCPAHPGFVVHGLWPERNDGSYPEHCASRPGPTSDTLWAGVIPTAYLAQHEWETHGTCTPYDPATFFGMVRKAYQSVKIPAEFTATTQETMEPPAAIIESFAKVNTGFPAGGIVLSCGNNRLTAVELCLDKSLKPIACSNLRTCHANAVKITPQQ